MIPISQLYKERRFQEVVDQINLKGNGLEYQEIKGMAFLQLQDYKNALTCFENLVKEQPKSSHFYHIGLSKMNLNDFQGAIENFDESKCDNQFKVPSEINIAHCLFELNEPHQAVELLKSVLQKNNKIIPAVNMLLQHYIFTEDKKNLGETLKTYETLIINSYQYIKSLCYYHYLNKDYKVIETVVLNRKNPTKELYNIYAKSLIKTASFEQAAEVYLKLVDAEPQNKVHWFNLASAYSHLTSEEDLQKAITASERCLQMDSNYHQAHFCKCLVFEKLRQYELAEKEILTCLNIEKNIEYLYKYAEILNYKEELQKGIEVIEELLQIDRSNGLAKRLKGIIYLKMNQLNLSEQNLQDSLIKDDTDQRAIAYYVISKLGQNKLDEVEEFLALGHFVKEFHFDPNPDYKSLKDFNDNFANDIKNHSQLRREPNGLAARNGYLTDNLFNDETTAIMLFKKLLMESINTYIEELPDDLTHHMLKHKTKEFEINSWATWVKGDGFIDKHIHEESWISGAYYCKVPKITETTEDYLGYFEYGCIPNDIQIEVPKKRGYIKPEEGKLIIFPSYLYHQTIPHVSDEDRISVAFDLTPMSWKK